VIPAATGIGIGITDVAKSKANTENMSAPIKSRENSLQESAGAALLDPRGP
jgi:hypothetical protein